MARKIEKRIEMGTGLAFDMAGRWVGVSTKKGDVCRKLRGLKSLTRQYRYHDVRLVAEVLRKK